MSRARITLDRDFTIGEVPRRLFGSFVEHMGRCVYTGIYEPGHPRPTRTASARTSRSSSRSWAPPSSATPAATSSPATTGRTASAPRKTGPAAWTGLAHGRDQRLRPARVHGLVQAGRHRNHGGHQPGHPGSGRGPRDRGVRQPPRRHLLSDLRAKNGAQGPVRHQAVVPGQRDGRAVADRPQDRRRVRPAGRRRRPRPCGSWTRTSNWWPAAAPTPGMPTFGAWEQTVLDPHLRRGGLRLPPRLLPGARRRRRQLPRLAPSTPTTSSSR